ncbi:MAG: type II toxin-antitoxin system PemK/MazF family toxin [Defluviitaleaceae bacterium]|nr:type II toxin-antitoxin system PemK/MazF family toxin [Defluviitaleaceae bacterium]
MGKFVKGDVVVLPFPFSDLSSSKRRPALVVAIASSDDVILAQITSRNFSDNYAVELSDADFSDGVLNVLSNIRPNKLFTAEVGLIINKVGNIKLQKMKEIAATITALISV